MPGSVFYPGARKIFKTQATNVVLRSESTKLMGRHVMELRTGGVGMHLTWNGGFGELEKVLVEKVTSALGLKRVPELL